jgi:putative ATP-dependent endonuclease of OLD family
VEGKQDKSRLPLLLEKYYSEIYDKEGNLSRISIITTNSCTNIKTYANLKYMNQVYLRDQFLMIRDGDGKNPEELAGQLCRYYEERNLEDIDKLPKVTRRNVLILKYYSFENYFLNPKIMAELGIVESEDAFYRILFNKWNEYLHRLKSGKHFLEVVGTEMDSIDQLKEHMEEFRIYMRGHNLYDIFYGPYRGREADLLKRYIELAPREDFKDILNAIDQFVYFESRKAEGEGI